MDKQDVSIIEKINLKNFFPFCVVFRNILSSRCMKIQILTCHLTSMMQDLHLQLSKFYLVCYGTTFHFLLTLDIFLYLVENHIRQSFQRNLSLGVIN